MHEPIIIDPESTGATPESDRSDRSAPASRGIDTSTIAHALCSAPSANNGNIRCDAIQERAKSIVKILSRTSALRAALCASRPIVTFALPCRSAAKNTVGTVTPMTAKPASKRTSAVRDEREEPLLRTLRSRLHATRALGESAESALQSLVRAALRAGATEIDATLTPRGLFVSLGPVPESGASSFELNATVAARLRSAFETSIVRVDFAERPQLTQPIGDASALAESVALCRDWLARVRAMEDECVRDEDVEGVHEIRIAIRRARAALRWLERCARDPRVEQVVGVLRALGAAAGPVRDSDVVHAMLRKRGPKGLARDAAMAVIEEARAARVHALVRHLKSRAYRAAIRGADEALASLLSVPAVAVPASATETTRPVDDRASRSMQRFFDRELRRIHERLEGDLTSDEGYHDVRRQLRRVRDIIDVCGPALGARRLAWRSKLQPVQSLLGSFNDVVSAQVMVKPVGEPVREISVWLKGRRASVLTELATPLAVLAVLVIAR